AAGEAHACMGLEESGAWRMGGSATASNAASAPSRRATSPGGAVSSPRRTASRIARNMPAASLGLRTALTATGRIVEGSPDEADQAPEPPGDTVRGLDLARTPPSGRGRQPALSSDGLVRSYPAS